MTRKFDVITGDKCEPEELCVLKRFPVNMLAKANDIVDNDPVFDMRFGIFPGSGVIQLLDLVPEEMIYVDTHSNAVGGVWKRQHHELAKIISRFKPSNVLEIGGGTGILERTYNSISEEKTNSWLIIDPEPNPIETNARFIKGFFPNALPNEYHFDMIVHSHTWEHAYSSRDFIQSVSEVMKVGQKMIFSIPNLKYLLEKRMTSILNFEHTVYLSDDYVEYLLAEFNFIIESKQLFENHSIMYVVTKVNKGIGKADLGPLYKRNKELFFDYIEEHRRKMLLLNAAIKTSGGKAFLFGGHITTQFYLAFGMDARLISGILDNDSFKHGKRVSGTGWIIESPMCLKRIERPVVVLPAGPYTKEIKAQIENEINGNTTFIEIDVL